MPRGRGRRCRQDLVGDREQLPQRVRMAPREEAQQQQPVVRNLRRRPPADADEEAPLERRGRVDEPQLVAMHPDVDIQVNEPQLAALSEKLLGGCDRLYKSKDLREPITIDILIRLNAALTHVCSSRNETIMFQTAFNLAFAAFLRVSEFAITSNVIHEHVLHRRDVYIDHVKNQLFVTIKFPKTDQKGRSTTLVVDKNESNEICPLHSLKAFLQIRPGNDGPLFCHINGNSLTRFHFQTVLNKGLQFLNLNTPRFNTHSFRIGAATSVFLSGKR
ncbi:unnamed protein product [Mytilus coruscus]|uniref:Tyr recombinase domain-containing protein n=1 Tax=Mytilus coruscus TaxID=42192 RepID=A0A6J8DHT5_MYTCO|nr:unnamed protein product [Mytilus coruscus]